MAAMAPETENSNDPGIKGVRWNEENLEKNENERCATMKIDEPPTPFNFEYCQDDEEDEQPAGGGEAPVATPPASISFSDQWEKAGLSEKLEEAADTLIPTVEANEISEEEREAARKKFDENRRKHYNMREVLRANYDEDEKVEDVQDEGPKGGSADGKDELKHKRKAVESTDIA